MSMPAVAIPGRRLKIGVYNLYWQTMGGGEQVAGAIAEVLSSDHDVDVLGPVAPPVEAMRSRLAIDLGRTTYRQVNDDLGASEASADYDLFVTTTYLSTAVNRAPAGLYYAHFPEPPASGAQRRRMAIARQAVKAIDRLPVQPARVTAARNEFASRVRSRDFLASYTTVLGNSQYTCGWIKRLWGVDAALLYPPVRTIVGRTPKRPIIVSVGRFFDARHGHSKKQLEMVLAFRSLVASGRADGWELHLVGGCDSANRDYFNDVRKAALGLPVTLHLNASGEVLEDLVSSAALYWHAGGYGEDAELHPDRFEHFGISVVEAMSAGAVPVVFGAAGPAEIVRDGVDGLHWRTPEELNDRTAQLIADPARRERLAAAAVVRAADFGRDAFASRLNRLVAKITA